MKRIVIKEIDRLMSSVNKGRVVSEYIIYVKLTDSGKMIEAHTVLGESAKSEMVNRLLFEHFECDDFRSSNKNMITEVIDEIKFSDYSEQINLK